MVAYLLAMQDAPVRFRLPAPLTSESPSLVYGTCFGSRHNVSSNPTSETIHSDADLALSAGPLAGAIPALHRRVPGSGTNFSGLAQWPEHAADDRKTEDRNLYALPSNNDIAASVRRFI